MLGVLFLLSDATSYVITRVSIHVSLRRRVLDLPSAPAVPIQSPCRDWAEWESSVVYIFLSWAYGSWSIWVLRSTPSGAEK